MSYAASMRGQSRAEFTFEYVRNLVGWKGGGGGGAEEGELLPNELRNLSRFCCMNNAYLKLLQPALPARAKSIKKCLPAHHWSVSVPLSPPRLCSAIN